MPLVKRYSPASRSGASTMPYRPLHRWKLGRGSTYTPAGKSTDFGGAMTEECWVMADTSPCGAESHSDIAVICAKCKTLMKLIPVPERHIF